MKLRLRKRVVENSLKPTKVVVPSADEVLTGEVVTPASNEVAEALNLYPVTIPDMMRTANEIFAHSQDFMVKDANDLNVAFNDDAGLTYIPEDGVVHHSSISRFALGQLGTKIGVPARYLEKCVQSGRIDLAKDNVNSWLSDYHKDLFIREYDGRIRGVLSNKYSVCDSHEILDVVDQAVDLSNYKIKGSFLSEERLHVRLVSKQMLPIDGEDLFAGLFLDSSDVGRSILTVQFGIYKQVCTNGLVVSRAGGVLFQQKHIGISSEEFYEGLVASLGNVDALTEHAVEWVRLAKSKSAYGYNVKSMTKEDMDDFISRIRSITNLPESSAVKVIDLMKTKYDSTRFGLINGITEVAQDFTLEKRLDLERIAGNLLVAA